MTQDTGDWDTEMLSMSLSGVVMTPLGPMTMMIRESPTLASTGHTTVTRGSTAPESGHDDEPPMGGMPLFQINSYFNVNTELSLDGGQTWIPAEFAVGVNLVPEPGSFGIAAVAGLAALAWRGRRRR
jgi:hypothetical protein